MLDRSAILEKLTGPYSPTGSTPRRTVAPPDFICKAERRQVRRSAHLPAHPRTSGHGGFPGMARTETAASTSPAGSVQSMVRAEKPAGTEPGTGGRFGEPKDVPEMAVQAVWSEPFSGDSGAEFPVKQGKYREIS